MMTPAENGSRVPITWIVLPSWVNDFNAKKLADLYLTNTWETSLAHGYLRCQPSGYQPF